MKLNSSEPVISRGGGMFFFFLYEMRCGSRKDKTVPVPLLLAIKAYVEHDGKVSHLVSLSYDGSKCSSGHSGHFNPSKKVTMPTAYEVCWTHETV